MSRQSIVSPIVDTHTGFQVQLSIHIRDKIKKEDIDYPLVDIDFVFQKVFCLPDSNRTGHVMEDLVEFYLIKAGLVKGKTYFKEMYASEVEKRFHLDLSKLSNDGKAEKRFDFVFVGALRIVFACECNFYGSQGSKLNETARSYKTLATESKNIVGFNFVWFTDGIGWNTAKRNLEETFDTTEYLFNLNDLDNGIIKSLINPKEHTK